MTFDEVLDRRIREIVREELKAARGEVKRLMPEQLAERWHSDKNSIMRLAKSKQLRAIRLSDRKMVFAMEEVLRFEQAGGIDQLDAKEL